LKKKIIVIGSGFGGLAASVRLAARGFDVELFEKRDKPGGRAYTYEVNGFKFDGGPSAITAPFLLDSIFSAAGRKREDYFQLLPVVPAYRVFDHSGLVFEMSNHKDHVLEQIERRNPADKEGFLRLMEASKDFFALVFRELADTPSITLLDLIKKVPALLHNRVHENVPSLISKFLQDDVLRQVFSINPLLIGEDLNHMNAIHIMVHHLVREWGIWYAEGGTGSIVQGLVRLFSELGGKIHYNTEVMEIILDGRRASGIRLPDGSTHRSDVVVANSDVANTYIHLLPAKVRRLNMDGRYKLARYGRSLFVIYFGTDHRYPDTPLAHHNMIFSKRYQEILTDTLNHKRVKDQSPLYLRIPTFTDPTIAPDGHESFCAVISVPHTDSAIEWNKVSRTLRDRVMQFLEETFLPGLRAHLVAEHFINPTHFENTLSSYKGAAYSILPTLGQTGWLRPHNRSEDIGNLYFVGAGTHPGAGLPLVLSSAMIVDQLIVNSS
jgi:phytoene desaturase